MITEQEAEKCLQFLANTDEKAARAKSLVEGLSEQRKTVKAIAFQSLEGSATEKSITCYADESYKVHLEKLKQAVYEYETLRNKRITADLTIRMWQSCNANRRTGNV